MEKRQDGGAAYPTPRTDGSWDEGLSKRDRLVEAAFGVLLRETIRRGSLDPGALPEGTAANDLGLAAFEWANGVVRAGLALT